MPSLRFLEFLVSLYCGCGGPISKERDVEGELASLARLGIWKYILAGVGIGPFKGQFLVHLFSQHLSSLKLRVECSLIAASVFNAGRGCGQTLAKLAPSCRHMLALHQVDETRKTLNVAKLLTIMTFYFSTGIAIRERIRLSSHPKLFFFTFSLLHWEFALCEMRKACSDRSRALYKSVDEIDAQVAKFDTWNPIWG